MLRVDIESRMKQQGITQIDLVYHENDKLAVYCELKSGYLTDYTNHRVNRKMDIWGYLKWENGQSTRVKFDAAQQL